MKVHAVSYSFSGTQGKIKRESDIPYLYTLDLAKMESKEKAHKIKAVTGFLALSAVLVTLFNLKGPKRFPLDIVEIADKTKGLNKLTHSSKTAEELKSKILYPLQCLRKGDKNIIHSKRFKSGVIITDKDSSNLSEVVNAFVEHAKELGIRTINVSHTTKRTNSEGKVFERNLKRSELLKNVYAALKRAQELYARDGQYTIINIGDIAKMTNLKVIKSQKSNFEAILENIDSKKFSGIVWAGWTTKTKNVPLFLNNLPILITKLVD